MWMLQAHLFANDLKNSSTRANGKSLWISSISRSIGTSKTRYGRHVGVPEAADAAFVAEGLGEGFAEDEGRVFDRVVIVDVRVAGGDDVQIDAAMTGDDVEHVREEANRRLDARVRTVAVQVHGHGDVRLFRGAGNRGYAHDVSASRNAVF